MTHAELRALLSAGTKGPWYYPDDGGHLIYGQQGLSGIVGVFPGPKTDPKPHQANAALIVAAVNSLEGLLDRVERLEAALKPFVHAHDLHIRDDDADTMKPAIVQTGYFRAAAEVLKEQTP